jgi:hypothetical protein
MPNTGERREITRRVNAKQAETIRQSKKLLSKTRQLAVSMEAKNIERVVEMTKGRSRERGSTNMSWASLGPGPQFPVPQSQRADEEASSQMYDEGCPNEGTSTIPDRTGYSEQGEATSSK